MEQQNHTTDTDQFLILGPTPNEPHTPMAHVNVADTNNNVVGGAVNVGIGSGSAHVVAVAKSETVGSGQAVKRGRGRPRKNDIVENAVSPATGPPGFSDQAAKRGRGRPRGSRKLQILASIETAGGSIIPHVLTVKTGEDLVSTIMSFFDKDPQAICILSATGAVSDVAIRQNGASHVITRLEGTFEILSLSGAFTYANSPTGPVSKTGSLSISLARTDGRVFGGILESALVAACPIQLVMASFKQNISSQQIKRKQLSESSNAPLMLCNSDSERDQLKLLKLTEGGDKSCPSPPPTTTLEPTTATTNGVADNVFTATSNGVVDNVFLQNQIVHSASVNGVADLDSQAPQPASDYSDQMTHADVNASVIVL
ncbi:AT-hook motif nuclear-localized protein 11-like [Glycine soja]|uniref:AT-hook motif nuclear-localized protein n=1 Tax=Glycine soja TaxID=3848 RepID=A0A445I2Q4_GLYSO|nr:AT-hook motif nuclear-localized protein 11-like [Glycine soja]RZB80347.1 AT-hook motif nuclear-localized protein 13 [Glycine soja]